MIVDLVIYLFLGFMISTLFIFIYVKKRRIKKHKKNIFSLIESTEKSTEDCQRYDLYLKMMGIFTLIHAKLIKGKGGCTNLTVYILAQRNYPFNIILKSKFPIYLQGITLTPHIGDRVVKHPLSDNIDVFYRALSMRMYFIEYGHYCDYVKYELNILLMKLKTGEIFI